MAGEEDEAKGERQAQPEGGAFGDGATDAEPFIHGVLFAKHSLAGDLGGDRAEQKDGGVEPEDGGDGGGEPVVDEAVVGVEVAAGLGDEEDADQGDEEHEIATEGEEEADAGLGEAFAGAAMAGGAVAEVVAIAFAIAAGTLIGGRPLSVVAITDVVMAVDLRRCEGGGHIAG